MMEVTSSSPPTMDSSRAPLPQGQVQKKRKLGGNEKVVVTVKVEGSSSSSSTTNQKYEGPPISDPWSWRKYGQKPIKGSPYPRGYYRCSTSKGCSAKKQVERCRADPSLLIITYTSNHSHADPVDLLENASNQFIETSCSTPSAKEAEGPETTDKKKEERNDNNEDEQFRYCLPSSPLYVSKEDNPFSEDMGITYDSHSQPPKSFLVNENSKKYCPSHNPHHLTTLSADLQNSEENNDFYDELEELPTSSFFSSFMRRNFFEERILVNPS